ncbi:MAG: hypothetical protein SGPRY_000634 [Prymnesium sp.]
MSNLPVCPSPASGSEALPYSEEATRLVRVDRFVRFRDEAWREGGAQHEEAVEVEEVALGGCETVGREGRGVVLVAKCL